MVEQIESPKKFNMKKVTILDDEESNKSRKSRLKQQRKEERDLDNSYNNDDSDDSGMIILLTLTFDLDSIYNTETDCESKKRRNGPASNCSGSSTGRFKCEFCGLIKGY